MKTEQEIREADRLLRLAGNNACRLGGPHDLKIASDLAAMLVFSEFVLGIDRGSESVNQILRYAKSLDAQRN